MENITLGISTGNNELVAWEKLRRVGLSKYFDSKICGFSFTGKKSAIESSLEKALKEKNIKQFSKMVHIGDTIDDAKSAIELGFEAIVVRTGVHMRQLCAAYVPYQDGNAWILTRIESILPTGEFVVCDEYDESQENKKYTVSKDHVTQSPSTLGKYNPGEKVLALWYDDEEKEWSTMFYDAVVIETISNNQVLIQFNGLPTTVQIEESKLARYPDHFEIKTEENQQTQLQPQRQHSQQETSIKEHTEEQNEKKTNIKSEESKEDPEQEQTQPAPKRRIYFTQTLPDQNSDQMVFDDEAFERLLPKNKEIRRLHSKEGTPLIDLLNDPILFPQYSAHLVINGKLTVPEYCPEKNNTNGVLQENIHVGRLSRILHQWRKYK
ncbi:haloacid dehalogenase-like hydrolase family protein [Histomonas meleagridis]|uniref:haloacid dehalogenase-like hydrolase family protein n=1 Tax=Histomonas meleagridis TaxID=135588 RepID=UPI00355A4868|nr:haloacid dehalogenase-like hydrolase family protein [Histomonas meleagridis]KAH0797438.1 haloacid dehalogenase-like hydrolase family protein [Histomonas meleagridis]